MLSYDDYDDVIAGFVDEFEAEAEEVAEVVTDAAERFRGEYHSTFDGVDLDEFDKAELDDFYGKVREEIKFALKACGLI